MLKFGTWYLDQFEYVELTGNIHFFCFRPEMSFFDKFGLVNQNCQFKLKFGTDINLNMQHSTMLFTFSVSIFSTFPVFGKFGPENQNC